MTVRAKRPLILGVGGTLRVGSSSERALRACLLSAEARGCEIEIVAGPELDMPAYNPETTVRSPGARRLIELVRDADGIVISSPGYHGSISGLLKNALDYVEDLRDEDRPYFDGRPVGAIVCSNGWQAAGTTLAALRAITHSLRGWPTPLGVMINSVEAQMSDDLRCTDSRISERLGMLGVQVADFAMRSATSSTCRSYATAG